MEQLEHATGTFTPVVPGAGSQDDLLLLQGFSLAGCILTTWICPQWAAPGKDKPILSFCFIGLFLEIELVDWLE